MKNVLPESKKIKLIISDLDGTLLNSDKAISTQNMDAIRRLKENNIGFTFCTGRIATMIEPYLKALDISMPVITTNGAVIWDPVNNELLADQPIDATEVLEIMDYCSLYKIEYCALTLRNCYFDDSDFLLKRFLRYNQMAQENNMKPIKLEQIKDCPDFAGENKIYKLLIHSNDEVSRNNISTYLDKYIKTGHTSSEDNLLDIMDKRVNKGYGVEILMNKLGVDSSEVCAFGDYNNDISMFQKVGLPVAMDNATPDVKNVARYVTKSNNESGLAWFINSHIL